MKLIPLEQRWPKLAKMIEPYMGIIMAVFMAFATGCALLSIGL